MSSLQLGHGANAVRLSSTHHDSQKVRGKNKIKFGSIAAKEFSNFRDSKTVHHHSIEPAPGRYG